jgi:hypothetical protein
MSGLEAWRRGSAWMEPTSLRVEIRLPAHRSTVTVCARYFVALQVTTTSPMELNAMRAAAGSRRGTCLQQGGAAYGLAFRRSSLAREHRDQSQMAISFRRSSHGTYADRVGRMCTSINGTSKCWAGQREIFIAALLRRQCAARACSSSESLIAMAALLSVSSSKLTRRHVLHVR